MRRPRLYTILLVVSLIVLLLPVGGIGFLRLYESALVRQTESELIGQGAIVAAAYKAALLRFSQKTQGFVATAYGTDLPATATATNDADGRWRPRSAKLDLALDATLPSPPSPVLRDVADPLALRAGHEVTALLRDAQSTTLAAVRVVDYRGTIVASTGGEIGLSLAEREEVRNALAGDHVSVLRERIRDQPIADIGSISRTSGVRVYVAVPIIDGKRVFGAVLLARTPASLLQTLYRKRWPLLIGMLVVVGAAALVALLTAVTIARPLTAVVRQTERAVRGEKGAVVPLARPGTREVAQLSDAVAQLARTLENRADYIRDFAAHVSHEFKTPLTAIQGAVELLREHGATMTDDERQRFLSNLTADSVRLDRLVRRLLELARADVIQPGADKTLLTPLLQRMAQRYRHDGMRLTLDDRSSGAIVAMGEDTFGSILGNLLDNARQHGGAAVNISLTAERNGDNVRVVVADDGPGVSAANAERIFQPFFTTARAQGGTGLGLAVVKSLLAAHRGSIALVPSVPGAIFEILLPVVS